MSNVKAARKLIEAAKKLLAGKPPTYSFSNGTKIRVYDEGDGGSMDRYTVVIEGPGWEANSGMKPMLGLGPGGRGVSQFTEGQEGPHLGTGIKFESLDKETQKHIERRLSESG